MRGGPGVEAAVVRVSGHRIDVNGVDGVDGLLERLRQERGGGPRLKAARRGEEEEDSVHEPHGELIQVWQAVVL